MFVGGSRTRFREMFHSVFMKTAHLITSGFVNDLYFRARPFRSMALMSVSGPAASHFVDLKPTVKREQYSNEGCTKVGY